MKAAEKYNFVVNGYQIKYNDFWGKWQVYHSEIGFCDQFDTRKTAIKYAERG